jgi:hypothetical protein
MTTLREEFAAVSAPFLAERNTYARLFSEQTGLTWTVLGETTDSMNYPAVQFTLQCKANDIRLSIDADRHIKRVSCTPCAFNVPDGTEHERRIPYRDMISYQQRTNDKRLEAGVSLDRFITAQAAVAKRFIRDVYSPLMAYYPQIEKYIEHNTLSYARRDAVAAELCKRFNGTQRPNGSNVYLHFPHSKLMDLTVEPSGSIRFHYTPTLTVADVEALFTTRLKSSKTQE